MDPDEDPDSIPSSNPSPPSQSGITSPIRQSPSAHSVHHSQCSTEVVAASSELRDTEPPQSPLGIQESEATVVDDFHDRIHQELPGSPCGVDSRSLADVLVQRGIAQGSEGSEDVSLVLQETNKVAVNEEDCPYFICGEQESCAAVVNVGSLGKADADGDVSVKEESVSETPVTQEVEELLILENVEQTEKKDEADEKQNDLVVEETTNKDEVGNVENKDEAEGNQIELVEETSKKDDAEGVEKKDEMEDVQKEEAGLEKETYMNSVAENVDGSENLEDDVGEKVDMKCVDDLIEEVKGSDQNETASAGRITEEVDEMEVDDGLEENDKDVKGDEELDIKQEEGLKVNEAAKESVDVEIDRVYELNESEVADLKLKGEAEEDDKLSGKIEEDVEMNEVGKEAQTVNVEMDADDSVGVGLKLNEIAEEDQKLTGANEEVVKMNEVAKDAEKLDVAIEGDAKLSEPEGEDLKLNKIAKGDKKLPGANEEIVKVEGEEGKYENINELDKLGEEVNEAAEEEEEEEEEELNEAEEEDGEDTDEEMAEVAEEEEKMNEAEGGEGEDGEDEKINEAEDTEVTEETMVEEDNVEEVSQSSSGKRKRGKNAKVVGKSPSKKKTEEDVCFVCFDGGELVLCDRRGCPKAYHPSCVNRDDAFFQTKGKWNCGWHLCSNCEKNANYMCYTCTFSLCKGCIKDGVIFCVRGNKGFCETCMKTVMLIETNERGDKEMAPVNFDDKTSWEYLFKDYWIDLKARLSITSDELASAKHPRKGSDSVAAKQDSPDELYEAHNDGGSASDSSAGNGELTSSKSRKGKKRLKSRGKERDSASKKTLNGAGLSSDNDEWASKELLEFVMHMKNGDKSICSQFDVQALLLEYIKRNKLRDPRRKSQILCDSRLQHLFGKPRVGHFEMLKLLESHFLLKENSQVDAARASVDTEGNQVEGDVISDSKAVKDKKRKSRKKGQGLQSNIDDYGAIDTHNITLIYLKRSLVEELLHDTDTFNDKVVGSFVRLRISGNTQKQDLYRLVQIIGTKTADNPYRVGKRTTNFLLEILNLNKTEVISIDAISNQEFTEDECKRLRQSMKCRLLKPLTVGDIQEKAIALQGVRVQDTLEAEITRISHLRDRASDMGRRKELRECVEKLQLLKTPEERQRRLGEIPEIHVDPKMDPSNESEEEEDETDNKSRDNYLRPRGSGFSRRAREPISPRKGATSPNESWGGARSFSNMNRELTRNLSGKGSSYRGDDMIGSNEKADENLWSQGRDREIQPSRNWDSPKRASNVELRSSHSVVTTELAPRGTQEVSAAPSSTGLAESASKMNETQKIWHYKDPSGKVQGPFSMVQLRKWNNTGYFPANLRIWRAAENEGNSVLLADALDGNFQTPLIQSPQAPSLNPRIGRENERPPARSVPIAVEVPNYSTDRWNSETSLPSPTPSSAGTHGPKGRSRESRWSPTPPQAAGSQFEVNSFSAGNDNRQPAGALTPRNQLSHIASPSTKQEPGVHLSSGIGAQMHSQSMVAVASPGVQVNSHLLRVPNSNGAAINATMDTAALQSLVQTMSNNPLLGTQGMGVVPVSRPETNMGAVPAQAWGTALLQRPEPNSSMHVASVSNAYGNWGNTPAGTHSDNWRAPMAAQLNVQPSAQSGTQWGQGGGDNQNPGWSGMPGNQNAGWVGNLAANANQGWGSPAQNQGMIGGGNGSGGWMQGQQQGVGNTNTNTNNTGWSPVVQQGQGWGAAPGNYKSGGGGWVGPAGSGNKNWGSERNSVSENISSSSLGGGHSRDRGFQGGDSSGYGGRSGAWNRQSSSGRSGGGDYNNRGQKVCKYFHETGHCRKGTSCNFSHTLK
ncbi:Zinc finger CCCH domain-containing protein 19 [Linum perenne]